jgi:RHS repeat-associated protein
MFLRFPGQWEDASWQGEGLASGLYYNVHRWYRPTMDRYTVPDPIASVLSSQDSRLELHAFSYAGSNPLRFSDPFGLMKLPATPEGLPPGWRALPRTRKRAKDPAFTHDCYEHPTVLRYSPEADPNSKDPVARSGPHWHSNRFKEHSRPPGAEFPDPKDGCNCGPTDPPVENEEPWWLRWLQAIPKIPPGTFDPAVPVINPCLLDPTLPGCLMGPTTSGAA